MAHGVTPEALAAALAADAGTPAPPSSSRRPTTGWPPTSRAAPRSATRPASRSSSTSRGARTSASTPTCRRRALQLGADAVLTSTHKIVGSLTQSAMLHVARYRPHRPARSRAGAARAHHVAVALLMASLDAARRQLALHGESLLEHARGARAQRPRGDRRPSPGAGVVGEEFVGRPGVAGWDPLRIVIDVRGTGCTGYEVAAALRGALRHPRRARHPRDDGARARPRPARGGARALRARLRADRRAGSSARASAGARARLGLRSTTRSSCRRARPSSGAAEVVAVDEAVGPRLGRVDRRLPARHPGAAARASGSPPSSSPTCASCATPARACTAPATRRSRPSASCGLDHRGAHRPRRWPRTSARAT